MNKGTSPNLEIYAGPKALEKIKQEGFKPQLFDHFLGASGGPKWFTLFGLDKYLFGEFFNGTNQPLNLVGSSAGAFRASCLAQADPVAAITRLAESYSQTTYSRHGDREEITAKASDILDYSLGQNGIEQIINHDTINVHLLTNLCRGLVSWEFKPLLFAGLVKSMLSNLVSRKRLHSQYQRVIFHTPNHQLQFNDQYNFQTQYVALTKENFKPALMASGAIPIAMEGISNIPGAPPGMYRDGGIVDYHFDLQINNSDALTLYPHFNHQPKAGWFDKNLNRSVNPNNYDNIVMLIPSRNFIENLPMKKIPDRKDFSLQEDKTRIRNWQDVLIAGDLLADELDDFINQQRIDDIMPFEILQ